MSKEGKISGCFKIALLSFSSNFQRTGSIAVVTFFCILKRVNSAVYLRQHRQIVYKCKDRCYLILTLLKNNSQ